MLYAVEKSRKSRDYSIHLSFARICFQRALLNGNSSLRRLCSVFARCIVPTRLLHAKTYTNIHARVCMCGKRNLFRSDYLTTIFTYARLSID